MPKKLCLKQGFQRAQSLLEFAIFGSLLIMLLGVLINYGLKYNFQQEVTQEAFRKALRSAADANLSTNTPTSVTHVIIKDKHIPDPTNPFGIGSAQPISSQAAVTRSWKLDETADNEKELPVMRIEIQGKSQDFRVAGIRTVNDVDLDAIEKYKEIYGANNVWVTEAVCKVSALAGKLPTCNSKDDCAKMFTQGGSPCTEWEINKLAIIDPMASLGGESNGGSADTIPPGTCLQCEEDHYDYMGDTCPVGEDDCFESDEGCSCLNRIITDRSPCEDRCSGWNCRCLQYQPQPPPAIPVSDIPEIVDYNTGVRICRQIIDKGVCRAECKKGRSQEEEEECDKICGKDIAVPWYCESEECGLDACPDDGGEGIGRKYKFVRLNELFSGFKTMGVQPGYTKTTKMDSEIRKSEDTSGITTTDEVFWQDETKREIKYLKPGTREVGTTEPISTVTQDKGKEWKVGW